MRSRLYLSYLRRPTYCATVPRRRHCLCFLVLFEAWKWTRLPSLLDIRSKHGEQIPQFLDKHDMKHSLE
ncbi:hypothetical protein L6164_024518 [Bauhinia variegata]|uniref:Uncharacterized protein n=1 Tax=Bauhinia variegata TaxID=167791 RepID=A0ACB9LXS1_BAUVA|nr:hypothetical protein L6164_024518 [Bauhinia variegata]